MTESPENAQSYEELFAHRFSSDDPEYQQYVNRPADPPPVVEGWRGRGGANRRGRDGRYQDRRGQREGGWGGGRSWQGDHGGGQQHWQDRGRNWGHGSGHQSGPPSYHQGNEYHQRPHYDRY